MSCWCRAGCYSGHSTATNPATASRFAPPVQSCTHRTRHTPCHSTGRCRWPVSCPRPNTQRHQRDRLQRLVIRLRHRVQHLRPGRIRRLPRLIVRRPERPLLQRTDFRPAMNLPRHLQAPVMERAKELKLRRPHVIHRKARQRRRPPQHIAVIARPHSGHLINVHRKRRVIRATRVRHRRQPDLRRRIEVGGIEVCLRHTVARRKDDWHHHCNGCVVVHTYPSYKSNPYVEVAVVRLVPAHTVPITMVNGFSGRIGRPALALVTTTLAAL